MAPLAPREVDRDQPAGGTPPLPRELIALEALTPVILVACRDCERL
jgi:hypothetical protein